MWTMKGTYAGQAYDFTWDGKMPTPTDAGTAYVVFEIEFAESQGEQVGATPIGGPVRQVSTTDEQSVMFWLQTQTRVEDSSGIFPEVDMDEGTEEAGAAEQTYGYDSATVVY